VRDFSSFDIETAAAAAPAWTWAESWLRGFSEVGVWVAVLDVAEAEAELELELRAELKLGELELELKLVEAEVDSISGLKGGKPGELGEGKTEFDRSLKISPKVELRHDTTEVGFVKFADHIPCLSRRSLSFTKASFILTFTLFIT
jgi:hypothetical protein